MLKVIGHTYIHTCTCTVQTHVYMYVHVHVHVHVHVYLVQTEHGVSGSDALALGV